MNSSTVRRHAERIRLASILALPLLFAATLRADDWPQWRGPNRDGVWNETGILQSFPAEGLKVRWRASVGFGYSSPVVARGRVYLTDVELVKPRAKERLHCFDEATGKVLWTFAYDVAYPDWAFTPANEGRPIPTPIVHAGKVYAQGMLGHLFCLDAGKGGVLWQKNLVMEYKVQEFSCKTSPMIEGNLLILVVGGKPNACVVALDRNTGKEAWTALDEPTTNSSPMAITASGKRQLIVWTQEAVHSLDPASGKRYWRERTSSDYAAAAPVWHDNLLLMSGLMLKLGAEKPAVLWPESKASKVRTLSNTSTPLLRGDYIFAGKSSGHLVCLEASTGKEVWETDKVTDLKNGASIHMTPNGDAVFIYTEKGDLIRAKLTSKGYEETSRTRILEPTYPFGGRKVAWPPPAYANRHIFVRSDKELVCVSLAAQP